MPLKIASKIPEGAEIIREDGVIIITMEEEITGSATRKCIGSRARNALTNPSEATEGKITEKAEKTLQTAIIMIIGKDNMIIHMKNRVRITMKAETKNPATAIAIIPIRAADIKEEDKA